MAVADAGQVVVTASVPAAIGRTSAFHALGRHALAGLAGEWELFGL
jgi:class 3 adenylate cyclase